MTDSPNDYRTPEPGDTAIVGAGWPSDLGHETIGILQDPSGVTYSMTAKFLGSGRVAIDFVERVKDDGLRNLATAILVRSSPGPFSKGFG